MTVQAYTEVKEKIDLTTIDLEADKNSEIIRIKSWSQFLIGDLMINRNNYKPFARLIEYDGNDSVWAHETVGNEDYVDLIKQKINTEFFDAMISPVLVQRKKKEIIPNAFLPDSYNGEKLIWNWNEN